MGKLSNYQMLLMLLPLLHIMIVIALVIMWIQQKLLQGHLLMSCKLVRIILHHLCQFWIPKRKYLKLMEICQWLLMKLVQESLSSKLSIVELKHHLQQLISLQLIEIQECMTFIRPCSILISQMGYLLMLQQWYSHPLELLQNMDLGECWIT
jgi:hypothetical protein